MSTNSILRKLENYNLSDRDLIGNKAYNLLRMYLIDAHIPDTWVLDNSFLRNIPKVKEIYNEGIRVVDFKYIRSFFQTEDFIKMLGDRIREDYNIICLKGGVKYYAIRSSSCLEDSRLYSFAGMFTTILNIRHICNVIDSIYKVLLNSFSEQVEFSCKLYGIDRMKLPAVIIQEFVYSKIGGVTFRQNGVTVSNLALGLTKGIVDGVSSPDTWIYDEQERKIQKEIKKKELCILPVNLRTDPLQGEKQLYKYNKKTIALKCVKTIADGGLIIAEIPQEIKHEQLVSDNQMINILECLNGIAEKLSIENYDVEWCINSRGELFILQIRDLTKKLSISEGNSLNVIIPIVSGRAVGRACVVKNEMDLQNFKRGDILVTDIINGKAIFAVLDAAGCIIQTSSVLSHSAIIARELGLPCILDSRS